MGAPAKAERARPAPIRQTGHARSGPGLRVGAANDPAEREAEAAAERVARGLPAGVAGGAAAAPPPARRDDQPNLDTLEAPVSLTGPEQDVTVAPAQNVDLNVLDEADTAEIAAGEPEVRRAAAEVGAAGGAAPADVAARVAAPSGGRPLPDAVRTRMESAFGRDFGAVRLHDSGGDRSDAERLGARAFTAGQDIWLGPGARADDTRLIAHELTHVVQGEREGAARTVQRFALVDLLPITPPDYVLHKIEDYLAYIPGYSLIRVALGQDPITGSAVPRNATNIVRGVLGLIPYFGEKLFQQLEETHAIEDTGRWVEMRLAQLDLTAARVMRTIRSAADHFSIWHPIDSVMGDLGPLLADALTFASEAKDKILEVILQAALKLAGPYGERIWNVVQRARETIGLILEHPIDFAVNLVRAVMKGFGQFQDRFGEHMKRGLMNWLFGALGGAGIEIPARLDLRGLMSLGLQVAGLTWARWRERLARKLDPAGMRKVQLLETGVDIVRTLATEGFAGLWRKMLELIDNFRETVLGGIKTFVTETVIRKGVEWLASLTNPIGGIIRIALAIYDMIKVFVERFNQILQVAESLFNSMAAIARGQVDEAANRVEETMGRTIPVVISFVAGLLGLGGISKDIRTILEKLRAPIDRALERLVGFLARKAKQFISRIVKKLNRKRPIAEATFRIGQTQHRIFGEKKGKGVVVKVASEHPVTLDEARTQLSGEAEKLVDPPAKESAKQAAAEVGKAKTETDATKRNLDLESENTNQRKTLQTLEDELAEAARELEAATAVAAANPQVDTAPADGALIRAREPRLENVEGAVGTYAERGKVTEGNVPGQDRRISSFVENDHLIEKQWPKKLIQALAAGRLNGAGAAHPTRDCEPEGGPPATGAASNAPTPTIGTITKDTTVTEEMSTYPAISLYRPIHRLKKVTADADIAQGINEAAAAPNPVAAIKQRLRQQLDTESQDIANIYGTDTGSPLPVRAAVTRGLQEISRRNYELYGLGGATEATNAAPPVAPTGGTASLSEVPFTGGGPGVPDFLAKEGEYRPYAARESGVGRYMEFDHVVEKAWPLNAQGIVFSNPLLMKPVREALGGGKPGPDDPQVSARLEALGQEPVFHRGMGVSHYTAEAGKAIALYRPVHRAASLGEQPPHGPEGVLEGVGAAFVTPAVKFARTGDAIELGKTLDAVRDRIRARVEASTTRHTDVIAGQYATELREVRAANPGREAEALRMFTPIAEKVRNSIRTARTETAELFG